MGLRRMRTAEGANGLSLAMHDNLAFKRNQGTSARACAPLARLGAQPCLVPAPASAFAQGVPNVPAINGRDAAELLREGRGPEPLKHNRNKTAQDVMKWSVTQL